MNGLRKGLTIILIVSFLGAQTPFVFSEEAKKKIDILDIKNMDVLDVFKLISQKSGLNIIAGSSVKGHVSAYLKDIEAQEALTIIVDAYGWAYSKEGHVIKVMTAHEYESRFGHKFGEELQTKIKKLKHTKVSEALTLLNQMKSSSGKILTDEKTNTLILKDTVSSLHEMEMILERIDVPTQTKVFELSYAGAEDIYNKLKEGVSPKVGKIKFDERSNTILVSDTPARIDEIASLIKAFDKKERVVQIDAKIVQVLLNDEFKLGVDWEALVKEYHGLNLAGNFDILNAGDKKGVLNIGTLADDNYTAMIEALQTVGNTDILSNPSITTLNNKEAKILVGSTEPYVTSTTTTTAAGPTTTAESVNFIEVGVKLYVTPTIHKDNFITIKLKPEVSNVTRNVTTSNNNTIPVVETSQAETTVTVKDGITVIIGGLIKEEEIKTVNKVPLLGSIPLLGSAFRNTNDLKRKTEIIIFLTPTIISGEASVASF